MRDVFVVAGGSMSQRGLVESARRLGYEVCVIDGSPSAPLLATADHAVRKSFADVDGVLEALAEQDHHLVVGLPVASECRSVPRRCSHRP